MKKECTLNVLKKAMKNNDYSYDIYFRMAIIDEYLNGNLDIWKLYNKLQITRCKQISIIPREMMNHKNEFIKLICSIKKDGFDFLNPILINKDGLIIDGAHRMACAVYFNIPLVSTYTTEETFNIVPNDYSKSWFEKNDLNDCILLAEKQKNKVKELLLCTSQKRY